MNPKKVLEIISGGESSSVEFKRKSTTPKKLAKEIVAIANTSGGYLFVGVDDNGKIYGIASEKAESDIVMTACKFHIEPPIEGEIHIINLYDKDILLLVIKESTVKPHKLILDTDSKKPEYKVYIRLGEKSVEASREMTRLMRQTTEDKPLKLSIGEKEKRLFSYLEKNDRVTVKDFARLVNISDRRAERLMIRLVRAGALSIHNDSHHDYFTLK
ncbi:MAG: putative DNA binding domain-containing protein [Candidatus Kapabacteria bacterium]|nr:putative DNA binding domain-containing protein [Ignavibacteriota bacterium]MCW5885053.1 putative DNA binding domain-containing protein [Candidatus Kapabacteria bacterium]